MVMARVRKHRQAQRQARQAKSKRGNRYVIRVMRLNREGGAISLARESQRMHRAFSLVINNSKLLYNYINPIMYGRFKMEYRYR